MGTKTAGERSHLTIVNSDPANILTGVSIQLAIVSEAQRRPHLMDGISTVQWNRDNGVSVLVNDAGIRQHLANALGFEPKVEEYGIRELGTGFARTGEMAGVPVMIWNVEA
jgi:hypothetical protein